MTKILKMTTPNADKDAEQKELSVRVVEMQNGAAILEDSLTVFL